MIERWPVKSALCKLLASQSVLGWNCEGKYLMLAEAGVSDRKLTLQKCLRCSFFSLKNCLSLPQIFTFILVVCIPSPFSRILDIGLLKISLSWNAEGLIDVIKKKKSYVIEAERMDVIIKKVVIWSNRAVVLLQTFTETLAVVPALHRSGPSTKGCPCWGSSY